MPIFSTSKQQATDSFWGANTLRCRADTTSTGRELRRSIVATFVITACVLGIIGVVAGAYPSLALEAGYLEWPPGFG
jgi:hypothetical protein